MLPDLTVAENLALAAAGVKPTAQWMREQLRRVDLRVSLGARLEDLTVAQRQLLELTKAIAADPRVLILDEPTAPLGADRVATVFELVRAAARGGAAVIYISHRLAEVRQIADRVTVMRDGAVRGSAPIDEMSDDEMLRLIVGRAVETTFPSKHEGAVSEGGLAVADLSNHAFKGVALDVSPGEIVGLAGIAGNGQSEFLRALAGLEPASGEVSLGRGEARPRQSCRRPARRDRLHARRPPRGGSAHGAVGARERDSVLPAALCLKRRGQPAGRDRGGQA